MFDLDKWNEIWTTISRNKSRSLLTAFGVFWGILMLTLLLGVGNGFENGMKSNFEGMSMNSCYIFSNRTSLPYMGFKKGRSWDLSTTDAEDVTAQIKGAFDVVPIIFGNAGGNNVMYGNKSGHYSVRGNGPDMVKLEQQRFLYGRYINKIDIQEKRKVCVIGKNVYNDLFPKGTDPCGAILKCNGNFYRIIGVTEGVCQNISIGGKTDNMVILPFSTIQQVYNYGDVVHCIAIGTNANYSISVIEEDIKDMLRLHHQIAPADEQAISSLNLDKTFKSFNYLFLGIRILIWIIGIGSLLAGIIGVSNIMLISVRERTKEIGIRRALGAKPFHIISQIMAESLTLTALAGLTGLVCGTGILNIIDKILSNAPASNEGIQLINMMIDIKTGTASLLILMLFGLLSGLLPAWRAMQIKPIEALNEE